MGGRKMIARAVEWLKRILMFGLKPTDRDAVYGDLLEANEGNVQMLLSLLGFVLRRRPSAWKIGALIPVGLILCLLSSRLSDRVSIMSWFYVNNWTVGYLADGFRADLVSNFATVAVCSLTLLSWAWISGFLLARLLGQTIFPGGIFLAALLAVTELFLIREDSGTFNAAVFSLTIYGRLLPITLLVLLVVTPAVCGAVSSLRYLSTTRI